MRKMIPILSFLCCSIVYPQTKENSDCSTRIEDIFNTHTLKIRYEASQILYPAVKDKNSYLYGIPKETLTYYFNMITNNPMEIDKEVLPDSMEAYIYIHCNCKK